MSSLASVTVEELDLVVLGQVQYSFAVGDTGGFSLSGVLVPCCAARAAAVDHEVHSVSEVARRRATKVEDVGNGLARASYIVSCMSDDADAPTYYFPKSVRDELEDDMTRYSRLYELRDIVRPYEMTYKDSTGNVYSMNSTLNDACSKLDKKSSASDKCGVEAIKYNTIQLIQSAIQLQLDQENNSLKQTSNSLQSFVSKRDSAYELIGKVEKKLNKTAGTAISSMGS